MFFIIFIYWTRLLKKKKKHNECMRFHVYDYRLIEVLLRLKLVNK